MNKRRGYVHRHELSPTDRTYVDADGRLAEIWCHAELLNLTVKRARELVHIHACHPPDDCNVHLAAAVMLCE